MNTNTISKVFLVLLVTPWPNQTLAKNLISSACDHTRYKELCTKTLESDSKSRGATNFEGLAKVVLMHATSTATQIHDTVTQLLEGSSSKLKQRLLTHCNANYEDEIKLLTTAGNALASKSYNIANTWVSTAMKHASSCAYGFKEFEDMDSLISSQSTTFNQLCSIVMAITNQLK